MNSLVIGIIVVIGFLTAVILLAVYNSPQESIQPIQEPELTTQKTWVTKYTLTHEKYPENAIRQTDGIEIIKNYYKNEGITVFDVKYINLLDFDMGFASVPEATNPFATRGLINSSKNLTLLNN